MKISKFLLFNFVSSMLISSLLFTFNFIFRFIEPNYFICNKLKLYELKISTNSYSVFYPISCDQQPYYSAIYDLREMFTEGFIYQGRPLYIFLNKVIFESLNTIFNSVDDEILVHIAINLFHLIVVSISSLIIYDLFALNKKNFYSTNFTIILFILLSPLFKWGSYDPANQTLTLLVLLFATYILKNESFTWKTAFVFGILSLAHRTFLIAAAIVLLHRIFKYKDFKNFKYYTFNFISLITPTILYNLFIIYLINDTPYDANSSYWGQFIWIIYYLFGNRRFEGLYHCMEIPEFISCYFADNIKLFYYLALPLILVILYNKKFVENKSLKSNIYFFSYVTIFMYLFYLFIGWYPPIRFSYYSLGHYLIILVLILIINKEAFRFYNINLFSILLYFLFLNHWNSPEIVELNYPIVLSFVFVLISKIYSLRIKNIKLKTNVD